VFEAESLRQRFKCGKLWSDCRRDNEFKTLPNIRRQIAKVDRLNAIAITVSQLFNDEMPIARYREVHMIRDTITPYSHMQGVQHPAAVAV
jgi:hypothetical protein